MVDLGKYGEENAFGFLHVMYVFVVAILLINFLIALMSNSVAEVAEHKDIVMMIQRLAVACTLEMRLGWLLGWLYRRLPAAGLPPGSWKDLPGQSRVQLSKCRQREGERL